MPFSMLFQGQITFFNGMVYFLLRKWKEHSILSIKGLVHLSATLIFNIAPSNDHELIFLMYQVNKLKTFFNRVNHYINFEKKKQIKNTLLVLSFVMSV